MFVSFNMKKYLLLCWSLVWFNLAHAQENAAEADADWEKYLNDGVRTSSKLALVLHAADPLLFGSITAGVQFLPSKYFGIEAGTGFGLMNKGLLPYSLNVTDDPVIYYFSDQQEPLPYVNSFKPKSTNYMIFHVPFTHNTVSNFITLGVYVRNRTAELIFDSPDLSQEENLVRSRSTGICLNQQGPLSKNLLFGLSFGMGRETHTVKNLPHYTSRNAGPTDFVRKEYSTRTTDLFLQIKLAYAL